MKNNTVEEIEAIMKEAEDVEIKVRDSECVFVPKTWLYSKLTTLTQHHQDQLREVYREIIDYYDNHYSDGVYPWSVVETVKDLAQSRGIDISDKKN